MTLERFPFAAAIAYLHELVEHDVAPDDALARLRPLREAHPDVGLELVWEADFTGRPRYELLIGGRDSATACLSLTPHDDVPFAIRGARPWADADALERELAVARLRHRSVGAEAEASFAADPRRWDRVALAAFLASDYAHAMTCVEALRAGEPWHALAERTLGKRTDGPRESRSVLYESVRRRHIETLGQFALGDAMFLAAHLEGRGPYVVQVRSIAAAVWDDATREAIEQDLFADRMRGAERGTARFDHPRGPWAGRA